MDLIDEWAAYLRARNRSPATIRAYLSTARELPPLVGWTVDDAEGWWAAQQHLAPATRARKLASVRSLIRWAIRHDRIAADPTRRLDAPTLPTGAPRFVARADLDKLRATLPDDLRRAVVLGAWAGLRVAEIAALDWGDVDVDGLWLLVRHGKGDKSRRVPMSPLLLDELLPVLPPGHGVVTRSQDRPTADALQRRLNRAMAAAGVQETAHALRHRYGTITYGATGDPLAVAAAMGHASLETTRRYAQVGDDALHKVAAAAVR